MAFKIDDFAPQSGPTAMRRDGVQKDMSPCLSIFVARVDIITWNSECRSRLNSITRMIVGEK